jgi:Spy/CpxP family protein refolding chaperone
MKLIVPIIVVVILVSLGVVSCGGPRRGGHANKTDYVVKKLSKELDLTEDQQTRVRDLADRTWADMESRKPDWQSKREEVKGLFLSEELTPEDVEQFVEQNTPDHEEMRSLFAERLAEFHAILTPDQREELVETVDRKWHRRGRGHRGWRRR